MKFLGNLLWFLFGLIQAAVYFFYGVFCCVTLVLIPFGIAYFRLAKLSLLPFGKTVTTDYNAHPAGNVIWLACNGGLPIFYAILGGLLCVTIVGIPFGKQCFKLMRLAATPFGATVAK